MLAPQHTQRHAHALACVAVGAIMFEVDGGGGAVVLAHGVHAGGFAHGGGVGRHRFRGERFEPCVAQAHQLADIEIGRGVDERFRKRRRLDQEKPVPVGRRKRHVGVFVHRQRGGDVEQHGALDVDGMIDTQPMRHTRPAVMRAQPEAAEAERAHHLHLVLRHGALAVFRVPGAAGRFGRGAIAAQIGRHDGVVVRQFLRDLVPDHMALRMAVQQ